jgi:Aspartyl protease/PDZ domain
MLYRCVFCLVIICLCFTHAGAQTVSKKSVLITSFPFRLAPGGVIILKGGIRSLSDSLSFIFDTGCGGVSLDSTTAAQMALNFEPTEKVIRTVSGVHPLRMMTNASLMLPGLRIDSLSFHSNDYEMLTSVYGERIDGLIGYAVISRYIIRIDFDRNVIEFWSKGKTDYPKGGLRFHPGGGTVPRQSLTVREEADIPSSYIYDMGAGLNMMFSSAFVEENKLFAGKSMLPKAVIGPGSKVDVKVAVLNSVSIGKFRFRKVPVYIFDDVNNITMFPAFGGLIGNDLLRRFNMILNYSDRVIHLSPNNSFRDPFDYSYTGFDIYLVDDKIIVGNVAPGSPAEKAGLVEEDEVFAIGNAVNHNFKDYKSVLENAQGKLQIVVLRDGAPRALTLTVGTLKH